MVEDRDLHEVPAKPDDLDIAVERLLFAPQLTPMAKILLMALIWTGTAHTAHELGQMVGCTRNQVHYALRLPVEQGVVHTAMRPDYEAERFVLVYALDDHSPDSLALLFGVDGGAEGRVQDAAD